MTNEINIKQINLQHCKAATSLISRHMHLAHTKKETLVVLIQEPWINKNKIHGFNEHNMDLFYKIDSNAPPRTCIVTTKDIKATFMPQFSSRDVTTVLINITNGNTNEEIIFCSVYMPGEVMNKIPDETTREAINYSSTSGVPIIIGTDCNAHHDIWGSSNINRRGELLLEYISTTDLDILNIGNQPTFVNRIRSEVLDITLATNKLSNRIKNWNVSQEETLSDHKEINFSINCDTPASTLYRNPRNTDWSIFNKVLKSKLNRLDLLGDMFNTAMLENNVHRLTKALTGAFMCACPGRINTPKRNHWWNKELEKLKLETRKLYRIAKNSRGTPTEGEKWLSLRKSRNAYTREIRRAQSNAWINFCESIEGATATSKLHKLLAKDPAKGPGILKTQNGDYTKSAEEAAKLLLDTHFPGNVPENGTAQCRCVQCTDAELATLDSSIAANAAQHRNIISYERVKWALHSFDKYKSPGYDGIYPIMLQKGWNIIGKYIVDIYKACLTLGYVPNIWKEVKVTFIPKPGKDDYTSPKSFRPISLTSTMLKGMERIMDRHMKEVMNENSNIHKSQHAFQQGKSTETALHEIVSLAEDALTKKEYVVVTFMDIAGAFDNISFDAINESVSKLNICNAFKCWLKYMLSHRRISLQLNGCKITVKATCGTPQGGVISPTIWITVMDALLRELHQKGHKATGYADDLAIECRGKHLDILSDRTQQAVKIVERWCKNVGLTVNPDKSEIIVFTKRRIQVGFKNPKIFGKEITRRDTVKYLPKPRTRHIGLEIASLICNSRQPIIQKF